MNLLLMTLMYPKAELEEATALSRDGLQMQVHAFQQALLEGLQAHLPTPIERINVLPVGVYPLHYRKLFLQNQAWPDEHIHQIGCINLPVLKQWQRAQQATKALLQWTSESASNRAILLYSLYLPYLEAVQAVRRQVRDLRAYVVVTDLPNEWGIDSGHRGLLKWAERRMGEKTLALCKEMSGFVLLTDAMREVLPVADKPYCVMEGLVSQEELAQCDKIPDRPVVLYTGTLNREFGIDRLIQAFTDERLRNAELWLCGGGDMESDIRAACQTQTNLRYFGFVSRQKALRMQQQATVLVNPRGSEGAYTRYSFPSKTLEYMRSGKPVVCHRLSGIPHEYAEYLCYASEETSAGLADAMHAVLSLSQQERQAIGARARAFALEKKNAAAQARRILAMMSQSEVER